jgi:hypothetical protein
MSKNLIFLMGKIVITLLEVRTRLDLSLSIVEE